MPSTAISELFSCQSIFFSLKVFLRETAADYINSNYSKHSQNARFTQENSRKMRASIAFGNGRPKQRFIGYVDCTGPLQKKPSTPILSLY